ncbi:unnamed protein product [Amoebophrya sp. A25]|nr:unnamed protein product [Amoebophrya sp. A25]|eukprot:GSA25T00018035001.1
MGVPSTGASTSTSTVAPTTSSISRNKGSATQFGRVSQAETNPNGQLAGTTSDCSSSRVGTTAGVPRMPPVPRVPAEAHASCNLQLHSQHTISSSLKQISTQCGRDERRAPPSLSERSSKQRSSSTREASLQQPRRRREQLSARVTRPPETGNYFGGGVKTPTCTTEAKDHSSSCSTGRNYSSGQHQGRNSSGQEHQGRNSSGQHQGRNSNTIDHSTTTSRREDNPSSTTATVTSSRRKDNPRSSTSAYPHLQHDRAVDLPAAGAATTTATVAKPCSPVMAEQVEQQEDHFLVSTPPLTRSTIVVSPQTSNWKTTPDTATSDRNSNTSTSASCTSSSTSNINMMDLDYNSYHTSCNMYMTDCNISSYYASSSPRSGRGRGRGPPRSSSTSPRLPCVPSSTTGAIALLQPAPACTSEVSTTLFAPEPWQ